MEIAELVLKYVEALVWPLVTIGLIWGLRRHIGGAIGRMTRLETPAGSIEFAMGAREVRDEAEELAAATAERRESGAEPGPEATAPDPEETSRISYGPSGFEEFREARHMVEASPVGAVIGAWNTLQRLSMDVLQRHPDAMPAFFRPGMPVPGHEVGRALAKVGMSERAVDVFDRLRKLRNTAVHGMEAVTPTAALDFVDSCLVLARELDELP
ncbi:hypothetical protein AAGT00_16505 [Streptomyces cavourensis]